jgi:glycosyltransferase involved in cell wall biosynthesis
MATRSQPRPAATGVVVIASLTKSLINFRGRLLEEMVARGYRVLALAPDHDEGSVAELSHMGVAFQRIPMARTGTDPRADLKTVLAIYRALRRFKPEVLLAYTMKPIIYGGLAARAARIPHRFFLFTGFGYVFSEEISGPGFAALRELSLFLYRRSLTGSAGVFAYNEADAADIRRHRLIADATEIVPVAGSGVDLDHFQAQPVPADPPTFLMVARLLREKGVTVFAEAAQRLKSIFPAARFQLLGPFDPSPLGITKAEVDGWAEAGFLEYLGETRDVRPYLAAATVFVLPSYYREGLPRSALEALAIGRAVIASDLPGCREAVINDVNGFSVAPKDPDALADAMANFLRDPGLAEAFGAQSRRLAENRFCVHQVNRTILDAMERLRGQQIDETVRQPRRSRQGAHG